MAGWPWPLDGVQRWFEGLWNWISNAAVGAVSVVSSWIWGAIGWLKDRVTEVGAWIWNQVKPVLGPVADWIVKAATWGWTQLFDFARDPIGFISRGVNWIGTLLNQVWTSLSGAVSGAVSWLGGALNTAKDVIVGGITGIATTISSAVGGAVNALGTAFNGAMSAVGSWLSDALAGVAKALGEALSGFISWVTEKLQWIAQGIIGVAIAIKDAVVGFFEMVARGFIGTVTSVFSPASPEPQVQKEAEAAFSAMIQQIDKTTQLPRKSQIPIEALTTAIVSTAARFLVLKIGVEAAGAAVDAAHPVKGLKAHEIAAGIMAILDMPSVIGPVLSTPIEQGILISWRQYWASRYTPQIPGAGDLIRFVVREVIDVSVFRTNLALQGFSTFWADAYWEAHWELPARGEIMDAYHRGVLTVAEKDKFMVWHDYKPEARPGIGKSDLEVLKGIEKALIGRVDLRRGYELGRLKKADLVERFRWLGFEDDAELIAEIQIRAAMDAEIGKLRDNAKTDFSKGYIAETDLRSTLETLGYGPDVIEYHVQDAVQDRERARKDLLVSNYADAYVKGLIDTEDELAARLGEVIVDPDLVQAKVEDAYITRYKKPKASAEAA